jgi:hypothetical protein
MDNNNTYTFWQLLKNKLVEIPIIQRDYAQGREGKERLREKFLKDIRDALAEGRGLQLDFVYGTVEDGVMTPLDGQQRLTTLWLLHWYLAYRSGNLDESVMSVLQKFSYKTRDSSSDFCYNLARFATAVPEGKTLAEHIENQPWFCAYWKQDPTVQAMIRMLCGTLDKDGKPMNDGIAQVFDSADIENMWRSLESDQCGIVFHYLDLVGLRQSDDLYVKMNARGEQLTDFENFKADLTEYLNDKADEFSKADNAADVRSMINETDGFPIKMDRDWANIFWNGEHCDDAFMAFINRFFLNAIAVQKGVDGGYKYTGKALGDNEFFNYFYGRGPVWFSGDPDDSKIAYSDFSMYSGTDSGWKFFYETLESLRKVLDGYLSFPKGNLDSLTRSSWGTDFSFIPTYTGVKVVNFNKEEIPAVKQITQNERVLFFAVCRFLEKTDPETNSHDTLEKAFSRWLRVVWNLISDERMRSVTSMVSQLQLVDSLSDGAMDVYNYLKSYSTDSVFEDILQKRLQEEKIKAEKILEDENWEEKIRKYEGKDLSHGSISFLYHDEDFKVDWSDFDQKAENFAWDDALKKENNVLKGLVAHCSGWNELMKIEYDFCPSTWVKNLSRAELAAAVHYFLMEEDRNFEDKSEVHKACYKDLTETDILSNLYYYEWTVNGCHLREDKNGMIALFPNNAKSEQKKYVLGNRRNEVMAQLIDEQGYKCDQRIKDLNLFWGWDLYFKDLDGRRFKWEMVWSNEKNGWTPRLSAVDDKGAVIKSPDQETSERLDDLRKKFGIES